MHIDGQANTTPERLRNDRISECAHSSFGSGFGVTISHERGGKEEECGILQ